ncbi:collagen binding domain-containing protein [Atrimonas thermophila]|uniref:MSCRAMM family protein n=1 Tax=Atrimonas thermophila TaxID=3064161 RepID=UPI00399C930B
MSRKYYLLVASLLLLLLLFLTGCLQQGAQFGSPGGVSIQGKVAVPDSNCVVSSCANPQVSSGNEPAPEVKVSLMGENGNNLVTYTNQCGEYEVSGAQDSCYILYAKVKENMWVKQGIIPEGSNYNAGEANAYTTAQVIIYEVAKQLYPDQVQCSDIPAFVPTPELIEAVENALKACRDAQQDATVAQLASAIVRNLFGAPGGGAPGGGGIVIVTGGGGNGGGGTTTEETYRIEGYVWEDENKNGSMDSGEGKPNVAVYLTGPVNRTTMTDSDGKYVFDNLPAGNYVISIDPPEGYTSTPPPNSITVTLNADSLNNNFLLQPIPGSISGSVYIEGTTTGVNGVTVKITGNETEKVDSTEPDGSFAFLGLTAGENYTLEVIGLPSEYNGYTVSPLTRVVSNLPPGGVTNQVFYLIPPEKPLYSISGFVFEDKPGGTTGQYDSGLGEGVDGVTVKLRQGNKGGAIWWEYVTRNDGKYFFANLPAGQYYVEIDSNTLPYDMTIKAPNPPWYNFNLQGNVYDQNFWLVSNPKCDLTISGRVIGETCNGYEGQEGVKVKLWKQENGSYTFTKEVTTNANGYYTFTGLCKGIYKVALVADKDGLINGYPVVNPKEHIREVNNSVSGLNFKLECEETLPCQCIKDIELPKNYIKFKVSHPGNNTYFSYTWVEGVPDDLQGYTEGWCVDTQHSISPSKEYTGLMLSSIPGPSIYTQAQWNKVNYIINKRHQPGNNYSWEAVQNAIWAVLGQETLNSGDPGYGLWQDAEQNGGNYTPGSGEWAAALIVPTSDPSQLIIVEVDP